MTKTTYAEDFAKKYPKIDLNQSWDFSHKNPVYSLSSGSSAASTRAVSYSATQTDEYVVDDATLTWMKRKLQNGKNNSALGYPFYMNVPNNSFTIVPVYQGQASNIWELHAVIDGVDIKVWEKGQDVWVQQVKDGEWIPVKDVAVKELEKCTDKAYSVKAKGYRFDNLPVGKDMYFYLVVTKATNSNWAFTVNMQLSSLNGYMVALQDCPRPANISEDNEVMFIGCEDIPLDRADKDFNDVVFMIYAKPDVPKPMKIEEGTPITKKSTVRYMIEDLGSTEDFDFNDIVVDVSDVWTTTPVYINGVLDSWRDTNPRQEAVIRHLGGTLSFKLKIGNTQLEEHSGALGSDPNDEYTVTGWDKNTHNISVEVQHKNNTSVYYNNVRFPKKGEAPMIIAVDPTQNWMSERQSIPESWFIAPEYEE